jgi:NAD(P)H-hydrate epimerase
MSRISGTAVREIKSDPVGAARRFAAEHSVVCALKDARTVIAPPSGCAWLNTAGNSALAKAGSGDVLAGILAGIVTRDVKSGGRLTPERLARLTAAACFVHGKCGELLSEKTSEGTARTSDLALELHRFF